MAIREALGLIRGVDTDMDTNSDASTGTGTDALQILRHTIYSSSSPTSFKYGTQLIQLHISAMTKPPKDT